MATKHSMRIIDSDAVTAEVCGLNHSTTSQFSPVWQITVVIPPLDLCSNKMIGAALGDQINQMFKITGPGPWLHIFGHLSMVDRAVPVTVPWSPAPCSSPPSWWQFWSRWVRCRILRASECGVSGVRCSKAIGQQRHGNSGWMDISGSRVSLLRSRWLSKVAITKL